METNRYDSDEIEIDLGEVVGLLWHRMWIIVLCALAAGAIGFCISKFVITEQFESTTKIYILNRQNDNTLTYSDVQLNTQLTKDFAEIIKSRDVLEKVITACTLTEGYESFAGRIEVETKSDTRIIAITVTDEDPVMAQYLADEVRKVAAERIKNVMDIQAVNVVDEANLPANPASPSVGKWTAAGFLIGAFVSAAIILVCFMLDDTIKTSDDVEKYLGLSTLGMIPTREDAEKQKHKKSSHGSQRSNGITDADRGSSHTQEVGLNREKAVDWDRSSRQGSSSAREGSSRQKVYSARESAAGRKEASFPKIPEHNKKENDAETAKTEDINIEDIGIEILEQVDRNERKKEAK